MPWSLPSRPWTDQAEASIAVASFCVVVLTLLRHTMVIAQAATSRRRELLAHRWEMRAAAALRRAAEREVADAAWFAAVRRGGDANETLQLLCEQIVKGEAFVASGSSTVDLGGALHPIALAGVAAVSEPLSARLAGLVPQMEPWYGTLDDGTRVVAVWLLHEGSPLSILWAIPADTMSDAYLVSRAPRYQEVASFAAAMTGAELARQRAAQVERSAILEIVAERAFTPLFQPIVDLRTGSVVAREALTRFTDGERPDVKFATAWRVGAGVELETATLNEALRASVTLPAHELVCINVSPRLLRSDPPLDLVRPVSRGLVIELTEHEAIADYVSLRAAIARYGEGVDLSIDDAGSGYASLRHVLELAPRYVKLDKSLCQSIDSDPARQAIVAGLVHFATKTRCSLIAEGIETDSELRVLLELGVSLGQGFLLGRPAPAPGSADGMIGPAAPAHRPDDQE